MKIKLGKAFNIDADILGKVTFRNRLLSRSNYVKVGHDSKTRMGYAITITDNKDINGISPYCIVDDITDFNEGDVVLINKNGSVVFLFEIKCHSNVIMATERCNHHCIMCAQPPIEKEDDKTKFNLKLISLCDKNTCEIGISGGEPTLLGDNLFVLIKQIQKYMPHAAISLLTNGVKFANKDMTRKLAMLHHPDMQIDIPLFSDIAEKHNQVVGAKSFYQTVQGLYNLAQFKQHIGIRVVIHKYTYTRLPQLADFIYHNFPFVSQVAFMQMENIGYAQKNIESLWIDPYDYNEQLKEAVLTLDYRGMNVLIYNAQLCVLPEELRPFAVQSISDWKDVYISECEGCSQKGKCAGFFASNRLHSSHIKML